MRKFTMVHESEVSNTFVIAWPPGSGLDYHDHGLSRASIIVLSGSLNELIRSADDQSGPTETNLEPGSMYVRALGVVHRVQNLTDETVVSVHTYSPPLVETYGEEYEL